MFLYTNFLNQEMNHTNIRQKINFKFSKVNYRYLFRKSVLFSNKYAFRNLFFFVIPLK